MIKTILTRRKNIFTLIFSTATFPFFFVTYAFSNTIADIQIYNHTFTGQYNMWGEGTVLTQLFETGYVDVIDTGDKSLDYNNVQNLDFTQRSQHIEIGDWGTDIQLNGSTDINLNFYSQFSAGQVDINYGSKITLDFSDLYGKKAGDEVTIFSSFVVDADTSTISSQTADMTAGIEALSDVSFNGHIDTYTGNGSTLKSWDYEEKGRETTIVEVELLQLLRDIEKRVEPIVEEVNLKSSDDRLFGALFIAEALTGRISREGIEDVATVFAQSILDAVEETTISEYEDNGGIDNVITFLKENLIINNDTVDEGYYKDVENPIYPFIESINDYIVDYIQNEDGELAAKKIHKKMDKYLFGLEYIELTTPILETYGGIAPTSLEETYGLPDVEVVTNEDINFGFDDTIAPGLSSEGELELLEVGGTLTDTVMRSLSLNPKFPFIELNGQGENNWYSYNYSLVDDLVSVGFGVYQRFVFDNILPTVSIKIGDSLISEIVGSSKGLTFTVPEGPFDITPTFNLTGDLLNQTNLYSTLSLDYIRLLELDVEFSGKALDYSYDVTREYAITEEYLEKVVGIGSRLLCLVTSTFQRVWKNGICYDEKTRTRIEKIIEEEFDTFTVDPFGIYRGPVYENDNPENANAILASPIPVFNPEKWEISLSSFEGETRSFNLTQVPEPSTLAIFSLGMIGLASRRFKKQV